MQKTDVKKMKSKATSTTKEKERTGSYNTNNKTTLIRLFYGVGITTTLC